MTFQPKLLLSLALVGTLAAACGNNVGALYDPDRGGGGGGGPNDASGIVVVPNGGRPKDGRPRVTDAFPESGGWPSTVPVVVVFDEPMSQASVAPSGNGGLPGTGGGAAATVYLRAAGTTQALPGANSLLLAGTVVLIRPTAPLQDGVDYEIVVDPEALDIDAVRYGGTEPDVVGTFRADRAATIDDGRIVTMLPVDNARDRTRATEVYAIFDSPPDSATVTTQSLRLESAPGTLIPGRLDLPIQTAGVADPRIVRFRANAPLPGSTQIRTVVDATITFGSGAGQLDFDGAVPFSIFQTVPHVPPTTVSVGNALPGFPGKINATNFANATIDVEVDASVTAGSSVQVRVYGLEPRTQVADDLAFVTGSAEVPVDGPTTVSVPIAGQLGEPGRLRFDEGSLRILAQAVVGRVGSGFTGTPSGVEPAFDITPPTIDALLPGVPGSSTDVVTDLESIAVHGVASEPLGSGEISAGGAMSPLFGSSSDGTFVFGPLELGRRGGAPLDYMMTVSDAAGNSAPMAIAGRIHQRGVVSGALMGSLVVEAYDEATLAPIAGAVVIVDPGVPTLPVSVDRVVGATDASGRLMVGSRTSASHTITVAAAGYDLVTLYDSPAAFASLPLRPTAAADSEASIDGTVAFVASAGQTALLGSNVFADPATETVESGSAAPTMVPSTAIRTGRAVAVSAFTGTFEPAAAPTYSGFACGLCGVDGTTPSGPLPAQGAGDEVSAALVALPAGVGTVNLAAPFVLDFAAAAGLGDIDGEPAIRVVAGMSGFSGNLVLGVGFSRSSGGKSFSVSSSHALPIVTALVPFGPVAWVSTQVRDAAGAVSRHRLLIADANLGTTFPTTAPPGIPTVLSTGATTVTPTIQFADRLDRAVVLGGQAMSTLTITDPSERAWRFLIEDTDGVAAMRDVAVPSLAGTMATSLDPGAWSIEVENDLFFSVSAMVGDYTLEERRRLQVTYARSPAVTITAQ